MALQILLEAHPDWRSLPVVVVDKDAAQGVVLQANRNARQFEIRPGMRYAAALSLNRDLRAGIVEPARTAETSEMLSRHFLELSPHVEPSESDPEVFFLRATGLDKLFGSFESWAKRVVSTTRDLGFQVSLSVGWTRFGTLATARADRVGWRIFDSPEDERSQAHRVRLDMLGLPPKPLEALHKLAIATVADFLALPPSGVRKRFGEEAAGLWKFAHGEAELPLQPIPLDRPVERSLDLDEPAVDSNRLLFILKSQLHPMLLELASRHLDLAELQILMRLEDGDERDLGVRPATPTLEENRILDLVRLKLENVSLPSGIVRLELCADGIPYRREQVHLFRRSTRRDPQAAQHALARLQAEHGEESVCRIVRQPRHLPEQSFAFEPWAEPKTESRGRAARAPGSSVRRILFRPLPLPRFDPEISPSWLIRDLDEGTVKKAEGPYRVTDAWWVHEGYVARDYWFAHTSRGDVFWVYWDHLRRQWFMQGYLS